MSDIAIISVPKKSKVAVGKRCAAKIDVLEQTLANRPVEMVPVSMLAHTTLNIRKKNPDAEKLQELADSILAVGLLQNLLVYLMPDGLLGVAAGGRRLSALNLMLNTGVIAADYAVPVNKVSEDMAVIISLTENGQRENMHPADQILAFGQLSVTGKSAADIGGLLGYGTKHVLKCLRLASMAPVLLEALAEDTLNLDQLQALSATEDHERQLNVWNNANCEYDRNPDKLRCEVLRGEEAAEGNRKLAFIGREAYEQAGGEFRYDLFTDQGFISDTILLTTLTNHKLTTIAEGIALAESWSWSEGRISSVSTYGEDAERYLLLNQPVAALTYEQNAQLAALNVQLNTLSGQEDSEEVDRDALYRAAEACREDIERIEEMAKNLAWPDDVRTQCGVLVSLCGKGIFVRRGIMLRSDIPPTEQRTIAKDNPSNIRIEDKADSSSQTNPISAVLVKSLSSERTLAVQAALAQQPEKALVIFVHDCLKSMFNHPSFTVSTLKVSLHQKTSVMLDNAPSTKDSLAIKSLNAMHEAWEALLPENWHKSWDWLLEWDTQQLIAVMGYCLAGTLDGTSERFISAKHNKAGKVLEPVESLLGFMLRDWWLPTKINFFGRVSKKQISNCLLDAGLDGAGRDVLKLKKGDAADLAEGKISLTRWVPECLLPVSDMPIKPEDDEALARVDSSKTDI